MRKIFIDCGAFDGCSVRKFKSEHKDAEEYEIYCFEPNPALAKFHPADDKVTFFQKAVWIADGYETFFQVTRDNRFNTSGETGASTLNRMKALWNISFGEHKENTEIIVETIDLGKWITKNFSKDDYIILKLDVEGSEYEILNKMISEGSIEYVNILYAEFHNQKCARTKRQDEKIQDSLKALGIAFDVWDAMGKKYSVLEQKKDIWY